MLREQIRPRMDTDRDGFKYVAEVTRRMVYCNQSSPSPRRKVCGARAVPARSASPRREPLEFRRDSLHLHPLRPGTGRAPGGCGTAALGFFDPFASSRRRLLSAFTRCDRGPVAIRANSAASFGA